MLDSLEHNYCAEWDSMVSRTVTWRYIFIRVCVCVKAINMNVGFTLDSFIKY